MIVLDTNVISSQMLARPDSHVHAWLNEHDQTDLFLTSITISELVFGACLVSETRRRESLLQAIGRIRGVYANRSLAFTDDAAVLHGEMSAVRRLAGRPLETKDGMIAAICKFHGATLATRNIRDFDGLDLKLVNPFDKR